MAQRPSICNRCNQISQTPRMNHNGGQCDLSTTFPNPCRACVKANKGDKCQPFRFGKKEQRQQSTPGESSNRNTKRKALRQQEVRHEYQMQDALRQQEAEIRWEHAEEMRQRENQSNAVKQDVARLEEDKRRLDTEVKRIRGAKGSESSDTMRRELADANSKLESVSSELSAARAQAATDKKRMEADVLSAEQRVTDEMERRVRQRQSAANPAPAAPMPYPPMGPTAPMQYPPMAQDANFGGQFFQQPNPQIQYPPAGPGQMMDPMQMMMMWACMSQMQNPNAGTQSDQAFSDPNQFSVGGFGTGVDPNANANFDNGQQQQQQQQSGFPGYDQSNNPGFWPNPNQGPGNGGDGGFWPPF
ncbi:hypothetical protein LTR10_008617 [Elasticomyces elasticus]|nr:hypothetical protein LTR10_008617 [Elasticomyces elasticus]